LEGRRRKGKEGGRMMNREERGGGKRGREENKEGEGRRK
jgi:hypothetical protein